MRLRLYPLFLALAILILSFNHGIAENWKASWISTSLQKSDANSWYCFRYTFNASRVPDQALSKLAVDTKYWLYINDRLVIYEGGLKRGPTPLDTFYDEIDIAPYLRKGNNTIAILVWYWGRNGLSHNSSGKAGLLFDCQEKDLTILSNGQWKAQIHPAYESTERHSPNFRLSEPSIFFNASKDIPNWYTTGFSDQFWPSANEICRAPCTPWNRLVKRPIPFFKDFGIRKYLQEVYKGDTLECTLPYNMQASPRIKVRASAGKKIVLHSDTYWLGPISPTDSLYTVRSEYITRDGEQEYESLGWLAGHKIQYILPKGVEVLEVSYRETGYNTAFTGSFASDDLFLNTLWKKASRTLYVCMRDNYMDCPDRERAQWGGDGAVEMHQSFYAMDTNSFALARKFYLDLAGWQDAEGKLVVPVPENEPRYKLELPAHSLMPLGDFGSWIFFKHTRDTATLKKVYETLHKYLSLWKINENGSLVYRTGGWDWGDWGKNQDRMLIQHAWYFLGMQAAQKMATVLSDDKQQADYKEKIEAMRRYLNTPECWDGEQYRHYQYKEETDDRANALLVLCGVADSSKFDAITKVLQSRFHSSPWMEKFVLESLFKMNRPELAIERMRNRYKAMVESSLTTLWELWEYSPSATHHGNTGYNHGWAGGPLILLSQYVGGITPDETKAGYYHITPQTSGLRQAETVVNVREGILSSSWQNMNNAFSMAVQVPKGVKAMVGIPKRTGGYKKILKNKMVLNPNGENKTHYFTEVASGSWTFEINY